MENKSFFGLIKDLFKETFSFLKIVAFEGGESDLLKKMEVKKGFKNSLKYAIWLMILPIRIAKYFINPDLRAYRFVEKAVTPFLFIDAIFGNENVVAKTYSTFVENLRANGTVELKANIEDIDRFKVLFVVKKLIVAFVFSVLVYIASEIAFEVVFDFLATIKNVGLVGGVGAGFLLDSIGLTIGSGLIGLIITSLLKLFAVGLIAYLIFLLVKIVVFSLRDAYVLKIDEMQNFLFDLVDYTHQKTKEIYGEDVPKKALFAVTENFVLTNNIKKIDMLENKQLQAKDDFLQIKNEIKVKKDDNTNK